MHSANLGLGFPTIFLEFYENETNHKNETNGDVIKKYIKKLSKKAPLCAGNIIVKPCEKRSLKVKIKGFISNEGNNKDSYKSEIKYTIDEYLSNIRPYIAAIDKVKNNEIINSVLRIRIEMALSGRARFKELKIFKYDIKNGKEGENEISDSYTLADNEYFIALEPDIEE